MTSRWAHWSSGTEVKRGFSSFLAEQETPAEMAKRMGLQSDGSGGYIDPSTGQVVARTVNNELVFYDPQGGAISAQSDGAQLTQSQPSWVDPVTGALTVPPGQPESPEEISAVPPPVPAQAPAGYSLFMNKKKKEMYAAQATPEQEEIDDVQQELDPELGMQEEKTLKKMFEDLPQRPAPESTPEPKPQTVAKPQQPKMPAQPTGDDLRDQYDWATDTREATMKSLQERYKDSANPQRNIDKAITQRYEPLQKLLGEIKDPSVRDRQAKAFVNAISTRHRNNNGTNALTSAQYKGLLKNRDKLKNLDFDEDGNYDFDRIRNYKKDMIMHDDISDDYVKSTYDLLPDHVKGALTHTSRKKLSSEELDALQEKYPLAKRMKDYLDYSPVFWKQYLETGGIDAYTGEHLNIDDLNIEHILPGVSGLGAGKGSELYNWTEDPDNKVLVHRAPNQLKGDRKLSDFLERQLSDYDSNQDDLYDFRADDEHGAQGAKMKTRAFDIENLANLLLDFGKDGKQEGIFKENLTPEMYDTIINEHKQQYAKLKEPIMKAFHDKFDPEDKEYHKLTPKKLEAKMKELGTEDQLGRFMMMRDVFNQINGLQPNIGQIQKNMKIGKKTLPSVPRTDPAHGGVATGSPKTRDAMNDVFTKSFLGKDRKTQEKLKRLWNDSIESGSNMSRQIMDDQDSEPDFYRRKERTKFMGLQAFHKALKDSKFLDDGVLTKDEYKELRKDIDYHLNTDVEDHLKLYDGALDDSGKAKANWFANYLKNLNEEMDLEEDDMEEEYSMDKLLEALSVLMDSEGGISSESPRLNFSQFKESMDFSNKPVQPKNKGVRDPNFKMELGEKLPKDSDQGDIYHAKNDDNVLIKAPKHLADSDYVDHPAVGNQEIDNLKKLQNNPHAVDIINHEEIDGFDYLAMENVKGSDASGEDSNEDYEDIMPPKVWEAIASIHKDGVKHGDLHSGNMKYVPEQDIVKMIDFGDSKASYKEAFDEAKKGILGKGKRKGKGIDEDFHLNKPDRTEIEDELRDLLMGNLAMLDVDEFGDEEAYQGYVNQLYDGLQDLVDRERNNEKEEFENDNFDAAKAMGSMYESPKLNFSQFRDRM